MPVCTAEAQSADLGRQSSLPPTPSPDAPILWAQGLNEAPDSCAIACCLDAEVDRLLSPRPARPAFFCLDRSRRSEALPSPPHAPFGHSASSLALGLGWSSGGRTTWRRVLGWGARAAGGRNRLLCSGETEGKFLCKARGEEGGRGAQGGHCVLISENLPDAI